MKKHDTSKLPDLLTAFDAAALGDGDRTAGANVLAAMAVSLGSVARDRSGVVTGDGRILGVGANLLVSGSLSGSLASELVVAGLCTRQQNFLSHLRQTAREFERQAGNPVTGKSWRPPPGPKPRGAELSLEGCLQEEGADAHESVSAWTELLQDHARPRFAEMQARPLVFLSPQSSKALNDSLKRFQMGRAIMQLAMDGESSFRDRSGLCQAVLSGVIPTDGWGGNGQATLLVTDPADGLAGAMRHADQSCRWVERMLWLVDGQAGPEAPDPAGDRPAGTLNRIHHRFERAMDHAWARRLDNCAFGPALIECDLASWQPRWVSFLKEMEPECPGITGAARSLLASLVFGLQSMVRAGAPPPGFGYGMAGIEALGRFLVHRMVNARSAMRWSAERTRREELQARLLGKLADGQRSTRELVRRSNRLSAQDCRDAMFGLVAAGKVTHRADIWSLTQTGAAELHHLTLEV